MVMKYDEYMAMLADQQYRYDGSVFRDAKGRPKCYNPVFQDIVCRIKRQGMIGISPQEYDLYGKLVFTLTQIVLNNQKFKYQDPDIREECRTEALCDLLPALPVNFDPSRGSTAYSYAFRICYTAGIHVLERKNRRNELVSNLIEKEKDLEVDCGHRVVNA